MFFIKKIVIFFLIISIFGCASGNITKINSINDRSIYIDTPNDTTKNRYSILLKEHLKRRFNNENKPQADYILQADISFASNETLSVSGLTVLNSTKAVIKYSLIDNNSNLLIKSGSINTFPALSSSSNSLYANEKSLENIKERLIQSSAKKLYLLINIILRKLIEN